MEQTKFETQGDLKTASIESFISWKPEKLYLVDWTKVTSFEDLLEKLNALEFRVSDRYKVYEKLKPILRDEDVLQPPQQ